MVLVWEVEHLAREWLTIRGGATIHENVTMMTAQKEVTMMTTRKERENLEDIPVTMILGKEGTGDDKIMIAYSTTKNDAFDQF